MNKNDMYVAMYRCLAVLHQEEPNAELGEYLMSINPYVFNEENAADPKQRKKFEKTVGGWMKEDELPEDKAYELVTRYLDENTKFGEIFRGIPLSDWISLCYILDQEKTNAMMRALEENAEDTEGNSTDADIDALFENPMSMANIGAMYGMSASGSTMSADNTVKNKVMHPNKNKKKKKKNKKKKR